MSSVMQHAEHLTGVDDHEALAADYRAFLQAYPGYALTAKLDDLRAQEYSRLNAQHPQRPHIYLDYTGGGLYAESQLRDHIALLQGGVFGNPHSQNPTSSATTDLNEAARRYVLEYFNASPDEYTVVFTQNASGALKLVGEAYPFTSDSHYLLTFDNHNSVNGIREFARTKGAAVTYIPVSAPDMRVDESGLDAYLDLAAQSPGAAHLFAYPAQSNFSGVQHPLEWIERARAKGWDVLVDCAAFTPTNCLDLTRWHPDFVDLSFYKMFGYPTGVGCLIVRHESLAKLHRPWFAGGTIEIASVQGDGHYLYDGEAAFEDGTINYLSLPAIEIGLRYLASVGIEVIHQRVMALTGWLIDALLALHHDNGAPLIRLYGPITTEMRGGTVTVNFYDPAGQLFDWREIEEAASGVNISLRTGCFCNPGASEVISGLKEADIAPYFDGNHRMTFEEFITVMDGKASGAVRISLGIASNFADVYTFVAFVHSFLNVRRG